MSVLYGKIRVNAKNRLPYDPTINTYPWSNYGVIIRRDDETGIFTISGTSTDGRILYLTSRYGAWIDNNYVGMKLKCNGTKLSDFYVIVRYYDSATSTDYIKSVNVTNNEYIIENYPYLVISITFDNGVVFNNDSLEIILYNTINQITVTPNAGVTKTVNMPSGETYVDIPLAGLEEYTLTANSNSETVLLNYGGFEEVSL